MTHPKARTKPRRRERSSPADRIVITTKGRALLDAIAAGLGPVETATLIRAEQQHEHGRATPCAPNRGNDAPAPLPAHDAGTAGAPPAHPAGKSDAAAIVKPTDDQGDR